MLTPAIASHEQNVCRLLCHVYSEIFDSFKAGSNHQRQSDVGPGRGNTGFPASCGTAARWRVMAFSATLFRGTFRAEPFLVFVSRITFRFKSTCSQSSEYCSPHLMPVYTLTMKAGACS